ncbi:hypothetical protein HMPREF9166_1556 [Selenomonas sp. oral taxon 149 str. 67H29BP]|nr:hypothetical protein HMPREF9166_1556 [Selenomonas sp. oral taxon 149 str. 67H29BP]
MRGNVVVSFSRERGFLQETAFGREAPAFLPKPCARQGSLPAAQAQHHRHRP